MSSTIWQAQKIVVVVSVNCARGATAQVAQAAAAQTSEQQDRCAGMAGEFVERQSIRD